MKKIFLCFTLLLLVMYVNAQSKLDAVLQGTIINAKQSFIELKFQNNPLDDSLNTIKVELNDNGQFYHELPIQRPLFLWLYIAEQKVQLYVEPEERIEISALADDLFRSINFIEKFYNNLFLIEFRKKYLHPRNVADQNKHIINDNAIVYAQYEDKLSFEKLNFIDEFNKEYKLSTKFIFRQKAAIKYGAANNKFKLPEKYKQLKGTEKELPDNYFDFILDLPTTENELLSVSEFLEFLEHKFNYKYKTQPFKANNEVETVSYMFNLAHGLSKDRVQNYFLTKKFGELLDTYSFDNTSRFISNYMTTVYTTEYRMYIDKKIEQAKTRSKN